MSFRSELNKELRDGGMGGQLDNSKGRRLNK